MLKREPRTFWMVVNLIALVLGLIWCTIYHDHVGDEVFKTEGYMDGMLIYFGVHVTFVALHFVYLLATRED
jgi:hypothetical protein